MQSNDCSLGTFVLNVAIIAEEYHLMVLMKLLGMSDITGQKTDFRFVQGMVKDEGSAYQPIRTAAAMRRHPQNAVYSKYPDVRVAPCFRSNDLLGCDLPLDHRQFVDKSMGLRHFSTKVCEKVKEKGRTNYNQVADELVAEYFAANNMHSEEFLDIDWVGLPATKAGEIKRLEEERAKFSERIRIKKETIQELVVQLVAYKSLVWKNREMERLNARPPENSILYLPFVIVNTSKGTTVDCAVSGDRSEYLFHFDQSFEVHDDFEALKRLGYSYGLEHNSLNPDMVEHIDEFIPPALRGYIPKILGGEMSDWESRVRSNKSVQYVIRDGSQGDKYQSSVFDQSGSDHSTDGSYVEMSQPAYTSDNYSYTVPAYDSEIGEDIELIDATNMYPTYSLSCGNGSYEVLDHVSRQSTTAPSSSIVKNVTVADNLSEYTGAGVSTVKAHQSEARIMNCKRPVVYTVASGQGVQKSHVGTEEDIAYNLVVL
ncbi:transcription factor E2F/dimerization partner [Dictyocaulus viviparus]|uniref:Transcription factor E2F/dimerization partner n=1 Tax=Dictyocaulus viviparus TaxID=29172 RepID=A0A0D8Y5V4_DICVI|nr:transcription factor E2F/dimerization partner [Dictyocaulus viviparus]